MNIEDLSPEAKKEINSMKKAINYLVGVIMKRSEGKADPLVAKKVATKVIIQEKIKEFL